jgi:hypothetical protein
MNTSNVTVPGAGVAASPAVKPTPRAPKNHGQIEPDEPTPRESRPVLPMILRGSGITHNLDYDTALERYGLWKVTITKNTYVHGKLLQPGDTAELTGDVVQLLVGMGKASINDPRMAEEAEVISKAAALGLPQKIREIAAFAVPRKKKFSVRPKEEE